MKKLLIISALLCTMAAITPQQLFAAEGEKPSVPAVSLSLAELARGHEQVCRGLTGDQTSIVLQRGEKQFVIYGVTNVRAVGSALEVTVKAGQKYSVNPADVFFVTNDTFGLK